jgi:hypothetical protein
VAFFNLYRVSCTSRSACIAVGDYGVTYLQDLVDLEEAPLAERYG